MNTPPHRTAIARVTTLLAPVQRQISSRVHAAGDQAARRHGWAVHETRGRFGFGGRVYPDPRFAVRDQAQSAAPAWAGRHTSRAR